MTKKGERDNRFDELYMMRALALAKKGTGFVSPNPLVGAVIVKNGKIIGEGYHKKFGGPHAEVHALRSCKVSPSGATLYVNLEPCNFFGKTPPCTDLVVKSGISSVVIGMKDPNLRVAGKGIAQLRRARITVRPNVLMNECRALNESFTKYITTGRPFTVVKIAQTIDGKIADTTGTSKWITNQSSREFVHRLRSQYDAVLVGAGTVVKDDPELTVRLVKGRNPLRLVLDGRLTTEPSAKIYSSQNIAQTVILCSEKSLHKNLRKKKQFAKQGIDIISFRTNQSGKIPVHRILNTLGSFGIASVLVEGGAEIFSGFIQNGAVDKIVMFISPKIIGKGTDTFGLLNPRQIGNEVLLEKLSVLQFGSDICIEAYLHS